MSLTRLGLLCVMLFATVINVSLAAAAAEDDQDLHQEVDHSHVQHWSYTGAHGKTAWGSMFSTCGSNYTSQSPIDIDTSSTVYDDVLDMIDFMVEDSSVTSADISNNGHTVAVSFAPTIRLMGGKLGNSYRVHSAHFHWGDTDENGSEHTVDNKPFSLEAHIVSFDDEHYNMIDEAMVENKGLAVVGILFRISEEDNDNFTTLITGLNSIINANSEPVTIQNFQIGSLLPDDMDRYYRYSGSLTTPGCFESVVWTVMKEPQPISSRQLAEFRKLRTTSSGTSSDGQTYLHPNYRATQPLNGRQVSRSFASESTSSAIKPSKSDFTVFSFLFVIYSARFMAFICQ